MDNNPDCEGASHRNRDLQDATCFLVSQSASRGMCYWAGSDAERSRLEHLVRAKKLVKPCRGLYAPAAWWLSLNPVERHVCLARTIAVVHPDWVFCGITAAAIMGWNPTYSLLGKLQVMRDINARIRDGSVVEFHRRGDARCIRFNGMLVTDPEQTALDCLRQVPFADGLAIADAATRSCGWDEGHLLELARTISGRGYPGIAKARSIALLVDSRSESGGESIARANMILGGYALPDLQVSMSDPLNGASSYRVDFAWRIEAGSAGGFTYVCGELDGREKYINPNMNKLGDAHDALFAERRREAALTLVCGAIMRFSYAEARNPQRLWSMLDAYSIPRVVSPLACAANGAPSFDDLLNYLDKCAKVNAKAASKLNALREEWRI